MAGHVRRPTLSKGEPEQTLRCSNAEGFFQVPAGPFRSLYPHSRHTAASEQLDFTICGTFLCSTWFPQGTCAAGMLEAGELLLMQGTESLGQQHEGSAWGEEMDLQKDWHGLGQPWNERWGARCHGLPPISALISYVTLCFIWWGAFQNGTQSICKLNAAWLHRSFPVWSI